MQSVPDEMELCYSHEHCELRMLQIKQRKGFSTKEPVRGHMASFSPRINLNGLRSLLLFRKEMNIDLIDVLEFR